MWRVRRYEGSTAFLEAVDDPAGAPGGSATLPTGLTDEPLTLEILSVA
jgi:hypothetical protein